MKNLLNLVAGGRIKDRTRSLNTQGLRVNNPEAILIHSTRNYRTFEELESYHKSLGWQGVGYHLFIDARGKVNLCRPLNLEGAHAIGYNTSSIGIGFQSPEERVEGRVRKQLIETIGALKTIYYNLPILSHTQAQLIYLNQLLQENGLPANLRTDRAVVLPEVFANVKIEAEEILGQMDSERYRELRQQIKKLKNCPGKSFLDLNL